MTFTGNEAIFAPIRSAASASVFSQIIAQINAGSVLQESTSGLDRETAEQFSMTGNQLRGKVTMLFIAHVLPNSLQVDEIICIGTPARQPDFTGNIS